MDLKEYFPIWDKLTEEQQENISSSAVKRSFAKGDILHNGLDHCTGLVVVISGRLRAYTVSEEGREVTLYRSSWCFSIAATKRNFAASS